MGIMGKFFASLLVIIVLTSGIYFFFFRNSTETTDVIDSDNTATTTADVLVVEENESESILGKSVGGHDIVAHHYGEGDKELLFVGGIHGGYSWNTVLVAHELMDYLEENPNSVPLNIKVTVIPVLNPDGLNKVLGTTDEHFSKSDIPSSGEDVILGRFNGNNVDLNRNFDCDWQADSKWRNIDVSGGSQAFSEPEAKAILDYVEKNNPSAVVVWYSAAGGVFSSECHNGTLPETLEITNLYAKASGYKAHAEFDFYTITGDMVNWLAKNDIPAISVLLSNHEDTEWSKNKKGIEALFEFYSE